MFPSVFNLAESAGIVSNATCGDHSSEVYCKLEINPSPPANQVTLDSGLKVYVVLTHGVN